MIESTPNSVTEDGDSAAVENTIPVLAVSDLQASISFYCDMIGFKLDWRTAQVASVSRDGHHIMLQYRESLHPGCVWIGGPLLVELWDKIKSEAPSIVIQPPTNRPWALEMKIRDPDANILWFGTEPLKDVASGDEPRDHQLPRVNRR